jgi:hypothetical protein
MPRHPFFLPPSIHTPTPQVDGFLLPPCGAGVDETRRRAALLARRTEWQALGIPEDEYPDSMRDDQLL